MMKRALPYCGTAEERSIIFKRKKFDNRNYIIKDSVE